MVFSFLNVNIGRAGSTLLHAGCTHFVRYFQLCFGAKLLFNSIAFLALDPGLRYNAITLTCCRSNLDFIWAFLIVTSLF